METRKPEELFNQMGGKAVETFALWAETNQRVVRELLDLSTAAFQESVRLYTELQQSAVDGVREGQAAAQRWQTTWQDASKGGTGWWERAVTEQVDGAYKAFGVMERNAQAVARSAERLQTSAKQSAKGIQETFATFSNKVREVVTAG